MSIGERIIELRKEKNLSQQQLAQALDVSRQAVSKWENDLASPDTLKLIHLADILETEVEFLATGVKPVYESPPIVVNIVKNPETSSEKVIEKIVEHVVETPVIQKVYRTKYLRNPIEYIITGAAGLVLGILIGIIAF